MKKTRYINILTFIMAYITTRIIYAFTGFNYNIFDEGLSIKLLIDLGLWVISYIIINMFVRKLVLSKAKIKN